MFSHSISHSSSTDVARSQARASEPIFVTPDAPESPPSITLLGSLAREQNFESIAASSMDDVNNSREDVLFVPGDDDPADGTGQLKNGHIVNADVVSFQSRDAASSGLHESFVAKRRRLQVHFPVSSHHVIGVHLESSQDASRNNIPDRASSGDKPLFPACSISVGTDGCSAIYGPLASSIVQSDVTSVVGHDSESVPLWLTRLFHPPDDIM